MEDLFDTHKFLFTLAYEKRFIDHKIEYLDNKNELQKVEIKELIVNTSPVSCRVITPDDKKFAIAYLRVVKVYDSNDEIVWDNSENDNSNTRVIEGY